jgi:hypothetical protein
MTIRRLLIPLLAFTSFLVAGLLIGSRLGNTVNDYHTLSRKNTQALWTAENTNQLDGFNAPQASFLTPPILADIPTARRAPQRNILIVAVDDIDAAQPRLEAIWLVLYLPDFPHATLMPIHPQVRMEGSTLKIDADGQFAQAFKLTSEKQPSPAFFEAVLSKDIWWNNYLLIDKETLDLLVDLLETNSNSARISHNSGRAMSVHQAAEKLISTQTNPQAGLLSQAQLAQHICHARIQPLAAADLVRSIFNQLNEHMTTDLRPEQILKDINSMLEFGGSISCEFPSLALVATNH